MESSTKGIGTILGDPKKAIRKLALPMMVAMIAQTLYNVVDAVWVAGLGSDALAAVGLVFPIFFIIIGVGNGLGIGASTAIARRIGAGDKKGADRVAAHALILALAAALVLTLPLILFGESIFMAIGAGDVTPLCVDYAQVIFGGMFVIFIVTLLDSILRGEGDASRSMRMMIIASGLNIVFDPIFIYVLDMGIAGAAYASVFAFGIAAIVMGRWFFVKKDTYVRFDFKDFKFDWKIAKDIFRVGLPAATEMAILSVSALLVNMIIISIGSTDGVAIYSSGWRIFQMAMIPFLSIGAAMTPVCAAAYGGKRYDKLNEGYRYATKLSVSVMVLMAGALFVFANELSMMFTYADSTIHLREGMVEFMRIGCIFLPFIGMASISTMMFQGIGKGVRSLISTFVRSLIFVLPLIYLMGTEFGITGAWWGLVIGQSFGSLIVVIWGFYTVKTLMREYPRARHLPPETS